RQAVERQRQVEEQDGVVTSFPGKPGGLGESGRRSERTGARSLLLASAGGIRAKAPTGDGFSPNFSNPGPVAACTAVRAIRALQLEVGDSKRPRAGSSRAM